MMTDWHEIPIMCVPWILRTILWTSSSRFIQQQSIQQLQLHEYDKKDLQKRNGLQGQHQCPWIDCLLHCLWHSMRSVGRGSRYYGSILCHTQWNHHENRWNCYVVFAHWNYVTNYGKDRLHRRYLSHCGIGWNVHGYSHCWPYNSRLHHSASNILCHNSPESSHLL